MYQQLYKDSKVRLSFLRLLSWDMWNDEKQKNHLFNSAQFSEYLEKQSFPGNFSQKRIRQKFNYLRVDRVKMKFSFSILIRKKLQQLLK